MSSSPSSTGDSNPPPSLWTLLSALFVPLHILLINLTFLPSGLISALYHRDLSISSIRHRWFAAFWQYFAPGSAERGRPAVATILPPTASGTVLDLGPGQGHWLHLYDPSRVTRLIAVEPNRGHHEALRRRAREAGLESVFELRDEYVQDLLLGRGGKGPVLGPGSVDCVVTLQVLCSVPRPDEVAATLYALLKRGGHWVLYEHVKAQSGIRVVNVWQALLDHVWPLMLGGCQLTRDTIGMLGRVGDWEAFDTLALDDDTGVIPHVAGIFVKA